MSLLVRWVNEKYQIFEDTLGLMELPNTKALTLYRQVKDILIRRCLPLSQCRGKAYDGASNMSRIKNGVQALVKQEESKALYVEHDLNLRLQDASRKCKILRKTMDFIYDLIQLIKFPPKRLTIFENFREEVTFNNDIFALSTVPNEMDCETCFYIKHTIGLQSSTSTLEEVQEGHNEYAAKANGLFSKTQQFEVYFGLQFADILFAPAEQFSTNVQAVDITVQ